MSKFERYQMPLVLDIDQISKNDAEFISWWIGKEFVDGAANSPLQEFTPEQWKRYQELNKNTQFIILRDEKGNICGFEQVYDLRGVELNGKIYDILGTGSLVAIEKGKGIGTLLVKKLIGYLSNQPKSAIGFCEDKSLLFHRKMNREVWVDGGKKLICNGEVSTSHLIVYRGNDGFTEELEASTQQAIVPYDFW